MSRARYLAPPAAELDEDSVRLIAKSVIDEYEDKIALPRHTKIDTSVDVLVKTASKIEGAVTTIVWLLKVFGGAAGILTLAKILGGHL